MNCRGWQDLSNRQWPLRLGAVGSSSPVPPVSSQLHHFLPSRRRQTSCINIIDIIVIVIVIFILLLAHLKRKAGLCSAFVSYWFFYYFVTIFQTNYLSICQTDPRKICRVCRVKYGCRWRSEVRFSITPGTLPWQPILWSKSRPNAQNWVRLRFARWRRTTRSASAALDACKPKLTDWMDAGEPIN